MADTSQFTIGTEASCSDGAVGKVSRVIVDPVAEEVTHLVVEPEHRRDPGRLVPLDLVDGTAGEIRLHCTRAEFEKLNSAEETQFIPATGGYEGYSPGQVGYWPYYGLGGGMGVGGLGLGVLGLGGMMGVGGGTPAQTVTRDTVPLGEVDVRRGEPVHATDGDIGRVQGLVIDPGSRHVTHVLLQEGHLWGRKEVAIPIGAVASTGDGIRLTIAKQEVQDLPPVDIDHPDRSAGEEAGHR
jgi:sporulation protein YlmC with PRC-barrel domain